MILGGRMGYAAGRGPIQFWGSWEYIFNHFNCNIFFTDFRGITAWIWGGGSSIFRGLISIGVCNLVRPDRI